MKKTSVISALLLLASGLVGAQSVEGFGKGLEDRNYPHTGALLLDSFDFQFTRNRSLSAQVDHHLTQILVAPDFGAQNKMRLGYHDKNSDDEFFYRISHHTSTDARIRRDSRSLDICDRNKCTVRLSRPSGDFVFVLVGFQLSFRGTDHHIDEVGVMENNGELTVFFNDKNDDDVFIWSAQFAWVPRDLISQVGESSGANERRGASRTIARGTSVVRGFRFDFRSQDHHIRAVSVLTPDGRVEVLYADKNADDRFDWQVRWALLR